MNCRRIGSKLKHPFFQLSVYLSPLLAWVVWSILCTCRMYKTCSKKDQTFAIKTLFHNILSTVPFKLVPSTGDTPLPTILPLLECFLERTFCDGAQFSYRIFLNLRVFKKRTNFLINSPTRTESALRLLSAPSGRFWQRAAICPVSLWALVVELHPLNSLTCVGTDHLSTSCSSDLSGE